MKPLGRSSRDTAVSSSPGPPLSAVDAEARRFSLSEPRGYHCPQVEEFVSQATASLRWWETRAEESAAAALAWQQAHAQERARADALEAAAHLTAGPVDAHGNPVDQVAYDRLMTDLAALRATASSHVPAPAAVADQPAETLTSGTSVAPSQMEAAEPQAGRWTEVVPAAVPEMAASAASPTAAPLPRPVPPAPSAAPDASETVLSATDQPVDSPVPGPAAPAGRAPLPGRTINALPPVIEPLLPSTDATSVARQHENAAIEATAAPTSEASVEARAAAGATAGTAGTQTPLAPATPHRQSEDAPAGVLAMLAAMDAEVRPVVSAGDRNPAFTYPPAAPGSPLTSGADADELRQV